MFTAAILSFGLIFVIIMGYLLLKVQGDPEETLERGEGLANGRRERNYRYKVFFPPPLAL